MDHQLKDSLCHRLDHLVLAVRDLDAAAKCYERLGFQVGARNRHPWGTENRLIQFDRCFIELITVASPADIPPHGEKRFSFGAFVRDYLEEREGIAMLVLASDNALADARRFEKMGIGAVEPFFFERTGRRPDGTTALVAFTLAFAVNNQAPRAGFFVCQHHFPENFWDPSFQRHSNAIRSIMSVEMTAPDPSAHAMFLSDFTGAAATGEGSRLHFKLDGCDLQLVSQRGYGAGLRHHAVSFAVPDIAELEARLRTEEFAFEATEHGVRVVADCAFGVDLRFERKSLVD